MKVLFLYPNIQGMNMFPPAIAVFTSLLKSHGHIVDLFDTTNWIIPEEGVINNDKEKEKYLTARPFDDSKLKSEVRDSDVFYDFRDKIKSFNPDLIAVSVTEDIYQIGIKLLRSISDLKNDLNIPTIMGGVFPTFAPEKCIANPEIDMICVGEGENTIVELCNRMEEGKSHHNIDNLWIKLKDGIKKNPIGPPVNIDNNPLLDLSLFDESRLYRPMQGQVLLMPPIETHRGCPYQCTYCNSPSQREFYKDTGKPYFRKKTINIVHRELKYFKDVIKAEAIFFWADTFFSYTNDEFDEFCEMYQDIKLPFWCSSRPETISEEKIKRLMELGLFRMGFGVEHGNEEFRKKILKRNVSNKVMIENFKILNKLGLPFNVNNIVGFPNETRELAMDTIELNRHIESDNANIFSYSPFHGTPLRKMAEELGFCNKDIIARSIMQPTLLNMPHFPPDAIEGIRRCFILYIRMPKSRWPEIKKAEILNAEGNKIWEELRDECAEKYMPYSHK